jgi:phosphate transport system substrate-binding protein
VHRAVALIVASALTVSLAGCSNGSHASDQVIVTGSTTIQPIAEVAKEGFERTHPGVRILVSGVGSSAGIENVIAGTADIGTSSRDLKGDELHAGLVDTPIAYDAIAVIVNPSNPVDGLTKAQVKAIFEGRITNWKQVGGPDMEIGLVNRDEASGTREAFFKIVLDKERFDPTAVVLPGTGQVRSVVAQAPSAIGYISLGFVTPEVKALAIDGVEPSEEAVVNGRYPISRVLHFLTRGEPTGLVKEFIDYVLSPEVQEDVVRDAGFIPVTAKDAHQ